MSEPNQPPTDAGPGPQIIPQPAEPIKAGNLILGVTNPHMRFTDELNVAGETFPAITFAGTEMSPDQAKAAVAAAARSNIGLVRRDSRLALATTTLAAPVGCVVADNRHGLDFPAVVEQGTVMTYEQAMAARREAQRLGIELTEVDR